MSMCLNTLASERVACSEPVVPGCDGGHVTEGRDGRLPYRSRAKVISSMIQLSRAEQRALAKLMDPAAAVVGETS